MRPCTLASTAILSALLPLGFLPTTARAQSGPDRVKVKVRMSNDKDADAKLRPVSIIPSGKDKIMMLRSGEFDVRAFGSLKARVDLYDREKLDFIRYIEPDLKAAEEDKLLLEGLVSFGGRPLLIARGKGAPLTLYAQELDPGLTRPAKPFQPILQWDLKLKTGRKAVVQAGTAAREPFHTIISVDSTAMLIYSPEIREEEGGAMYLLALVDRDLKVIWQQRIEVSEKARRSRALDVELDNSGNAYLLVRNDHAGREFVDGEPNFDIRLFKVSAKGVEEGELKLEPGAFLMSGKLVGLANGRVACAGIYGASSAKRWKTQGNVIAITEAGSARFGQPKLIPFKGSDALDDDGSEEENSGTKAEQKDNDRLANGSDVIGLMRRSDGGFFVVNEVSYSTMSSSQSGSYISYYHGPMVIRSLDKDGNELWTKDYRRWTRSLSPILGQVFCAEFNDNLYLFLWDSEDMAERRKAGQRITPKHARDPYSAYVAFNEKGDFKIKPVLRKDKDTDYISGWELVRTGRNEYFALGTEKETGNRFLPVRIDFLVDPGK